MPSLHPRPTHRGKAIHCYSGGFQFWLQIRTKGREAVNSPVPFEGSDFISLEWGLGRGGVLSLSVPLRMRTTVESGTPDSTELGVLLGFPGLIPGPGVPEPLNIS